MKQALHSICIPKKELKTCWGGQPYVFDRRKSQFYDFYEQIFTRPSLWQNEFIEIHQIFTMLWRCVPIGTLGGKGLSNNDFMKCFQSLSIARVDWRSLSNKNDILQSYDNLVHYAKSRHTCNIRYASKQNFCKACIRTNTGKRMFSYDWPLEWYPSLLERSQNIFLCQRSKTISAV